MKTQRVWMAAGAAVVLVGLSAWAQQAPSGIVHLTTDFRGPGLCLDVVNGGPTNNSGQLTPCANLTGQQWRFTPQGNGFRMTTTFRGAAMCLDTVNGGARNNGVELRACGNFTGQVWHLRNEANGAVSLWNNFRGQGMCLDVFPDTARVNEAELRACGNFSGQHWHLAP